MSTTLVFVILGMVLIGAVIGGTLAYRQLHKESRT